MTYTLLQTTSERLVQIDFGDYLQTMTRDDLAAWMHETRDEQPDLYAALVHIYVLMCKPLPH
jgi:hypothetical protein